MILDARNEFCDATALNTGAAGTYLIGNQIDMGAVPAPGPLGANGELYLVATVDTTATSGGAATLQLKLASDDTASISTTTATDHFASRVFPLSALVAGATLFAVKMPMGFDYERFLGILQVTGTAAFTAGKVNVFLTPDPARWAAYDAPTQA